MPMDYQGNAKKDRATPKPEKHIERVVLSEVVIQKKPLGKKIKDLFIEADFRSVSRYLVYDVLIPAAKNMMVDTVTKGAERMAYGETAIRRRGYNSSGPIITYNNPINRGYRDALTIGSRNAPPVSPDPRSRQQNRQPYIIASREEAEAALEAMTNIIETYETVSIADLHTILGIPSNYVDNNFGWSFLGDVQIRQIREGYLLDLPQPEVIK